MIVINFQFLITRALIFLFVSSTLLCVEGDVEVNSLGTPSENVNDKPSWQQKADDAKAFRFGVGKTKDVQQALKLINELIPELQSEVATSKEKVIFSPSVSTLGELLSIMGYIYLVSNKCLS